MPFDLTSICNNIFLQRLTLWQKKTFYFFSNIFFFIFLFYLINNAFRTFTLENCFFAPFSGVFWEIESKINFMAGFFPYIQIVFLFSSHKFGCLMFKYWIYFRFFVRTIITHRESLKSANLYFILFGLFEFRMRTWIDFDFIMCIVRSEANQKNNNKKIFIGKLLFLNQFISIGI